MKNLLFFLGRSVCHQIPERSFFIQNLQFPLCARCTGIYTGMFLSFLYLFISNRYKGNKPPTIKHLIIMVILWLPMMIDGASSYLGLRDTNNAIRLITGLLFGIFIPVFIVLIRNFDAKKNNTKPIIKNYKDIVCMLLILIIPMLVINLNHISIWWILSSVSVLTIPFIYIQIFYIILKNIFSSIKKGQAYFIASLFSVMIMVGVSIINKLLLAGFR